MELLAECRPDSVAIENIFYAANVRSALKLGHARGVAMLAAAQAGLTVVEYTPAEIKRAVVGYGRAEKPQVQQMVKLLLGLAAVPSPHDAADALAVAICHVHSQTPARAMASRQRSCAARTSRRTAKPRAGAATGPHGRDRIPAGTAVSHKQPNRIVIDVNGVGYDVSVPLSTFYGLGDEGSEIALRIHTHVREDALALYGFATALELALFERLIGISGIGPKLALAVLSGIEPHELVRAIEQCRRRPAHGDSRRRQENLRAHRRRAEGSAAAAAARGRGRRSRCQRAVRAARRCALGAREPGLSSAALRKSCRCRGQGHA